MQTDEANLLSTKCVIQTTTLIADLCSSKQTGNPDSLSVEFQKNVIKTTSVSAGSFIYLQW